MPETKKKTVVDGLEFWKRVDVTDRAFTRHVQARGGFTAIGAMYQVKMATEQWGPVGGKWWWEIETSIHEGLFLVRLSLFTPLGEKPIIQHGCWEFTGKRPDHDAPKKAVTDALTKCLSYLGFNADVFMGLFDDNKYVAPRRDGQPAPALATDAQCTMILDLASQVWGDGAADQVVKLLKTAGFNKLEDLPAARADKLLAHLHGLREARLQAPDPLPLNKKEEVGA